MFLSHRINSREGCRCLQTKPPHSLMVNSVVQGLMTRSSWLKSPTRCSISSTWQSYLPQSTQSSTSQSEITKIESSSSSVDASPPQKWSKFAVFKRRHLAIYIDQAAFLALFFRKRSEAASLLCNEMNLASTLAKLKWRWQMPMPEIVITSIGYEKMYEARSTFEWR